MTTISTAERISAIAATATSIYLSGQVVSASTGIITTLLATSPSSTHLLQAWKFVYNEGARNGPAVALVAVLLHSSTILYRRLRNAPQWEWVSSVAGLALTIAIVPYTAVVMADTNNQLMDGANLGTGVELARDLVERWWWLNLGRGALPFVGGIVSMVSLAR